MSVPHTHTENTLPTMSEGYWAPRWDTYELVKERELKGLSIKHCPSCTAKILPWMPLCDDCTDYDQFREMEEAICEDELITRANYELENIAETNDSYALYNL